MTLPLNSRGCSLSRPPTTVQSRVQPTDQYTVRQGLLSTTREGSGWGWERNVEYQIGEAVVLGRHWLFLLLFSGCWVAAGAAGGLARVWR